MNHGNLTATMKELMDNGAASDFRDSRVLRILSALAKVPQSTVRDIGETTGIPVSTVYRLVKLLVAFGFVQKTSTRHYGAGPIAVQLAARYRDSTLATGSITPYLRQLAQSSGELAAFMVAHSTEAVCVETVESNHTLRCSYSVGASQPLLRGATATVLLSRLDAQTRNEIYTFYDADVEVRTKCEQECSKTRSDGYAVSFGELDSGIWGVSAPVVDDGGNLRGAVTLMAPAERSVGRSRELINSVRRTAEAMSGGII
ncbi:IclR family transcriptional regulator [Brevibacterium sp. 'Marine']|uniref:IclR family transcriptional regulator n=1 Tax=Brevibacterium sp. 'Marine' TaxID=2725563 RepID=UPI0032B7A828